MVSFNSIPSNIRTPFVAAEFDSTRSAKGPALLTYKALLLGQKLAAGTAAANSLVRVTSADQVVPLAGRGSQLHRMAKAWFNVNKFTELWLGVLADETGSVAATGTLTIVGTATADGAIYLYIGGQLVKVPVTSGNTPTQIATAIAAAVGNTAGANDLPVTATSSVGVVTFTAINKGAAGNEIDIRVNYQQGESLPAGVTSATVVAMASGATNPVLTTLISNLGDNWFQIIAHPYNDATSLTAIENELSSRFGPMRMIDGIAFTAKAASYGTVSTLGASRNSPHSVIIRTNESPTPPDEYAAHVAAVVAPSLAADPARPLQTLALPWIKAPALLDVDTITERNTLLYSGIATTRVGAGGVVEVDRMITTYQKNGAGIADEAYLDVTTMAALMYLRFSFRARVAGRYPRHKLADDGVKFSSGQAIITPTIGKAEAISWFRDMEFLGLVENYDQFAQDLVVERNVSNPNRLDFLLPPDLINQLIVGAAKIQFIL